MTETQKTLAEAQQLLNKAEAIDADRRANLGRFELRQVKQMVREAALYRAQAQKLIESTFA